MNKAIKAPKAGEYKLFTDLLNQYNVLIAGCVGSGKSVVEEGMIYNLANHYTPMEAELYLIDPKMVELDPWRILPHTVGYADSVEDSVVLLQEVHERMMKRYATMKEQGLKKWIGSHIYVFIDEMADLIVSGGKEVLLSLQKIIQLGRAARVHLVCCTQTASRKTVPGFLQANITCAVGLHCKSSVDSRMIIGENGCEKLPLYGKALISTGSIEKVDVPMYPERYTDAMLRYWRTQR